jgi:pimeloyl-ACP methyl ester carboxylesterase
VRTSASFVELPFEGRTIRIEYAWIAPERRAAPLVVFLHEGLGSVAMWKDYPRRLCDAGDFRGLVYSRAGYGRSTPRPAAERWPVAFMHAQARDVLPRLLATLGVDAGRSKPWLFGHSDGGSIALIYAATFPRAVGGVIAAAPHIFVEDISVASIAAARDAYRTTTDLRKKLARYHDDVDSAFWGWNDVWLDPRFRTWSIEALLPRLQCPILAIQGEDDEYGTLAQVEGIRRHVPGTELVVLRDCGHSPHRDQPAALTHAVTDFIGRHALAPTSQGGME